MASNDDSATPAIYQSATQVWVHAEQIRWTLLYNYLMAASILLLAWVAVFTSGHPKRWVLMLLAIAGAAMSAIWILLETRANRFADRFHKVMLVWEESVRKTIVPNESQLTPLGPAGATQDLRSELKNQLPLGQITTSRVLTFTPVIFAFVYCFLIWQSYGVSQ